MQRLNYETMSNNSGTEFDECEIIDVESLVSDDSEVWLVASDKMPSLSKTVKHSESGFGFFIKKPDLICDTTLIRNITQPELYESDSFTHSSNDLYSTTESFQSLGNQSELDDSSLLIRFQRLNLNNSQSLKLENMSKSQYEVKIDSGHNSELQISNENLSSSTSENEYLTASSSLSDDDAFRNYKKSNCNHLMTSTPVTNIMKIAKIEYIKPKSTKTNTILNNIKSMTKENNQKLSNKKDGKLSLVKNIIVKNTDAKKPLINFKESNQIQMEESPVNINIEIEKKFVSKIPKMSRIPKLKSHH